jgi:hypothetical protein
VFDTSFEKKMTGRKLLVSFAHQEIWREASNMLGMTYHKRKIINLNTYAWFVEIMCNGILP